MKTVSFKIKIVCIFLLSMFFLIAVRLFWVQIVKYGFYSQEVSKESKRIIKSQPLRGNIYDRNMMPLATSMTAGSCYIDTKKANGLDINLFSKCVNMPPAEIRSKLNKNKNTVLIKRKLLPDEVLKIKSKNFPGVYFTDEQLRYYPENSLASYVVGVTGMDNKGLSGIEYLFDGFLAGKSQKYTVIKDGKGREINLDNNLKDDSRYVVLTIDNHLQYIADAVIKKAYNTKSPKSITCIIQNPSTGEILAMSSYPAFDPNKKIDSEKLKNPAVSDAFEPGSVFKIVPVSAALETHPQIRSEKFFCENGSYKIARNVTIHDHEKYGLLTFEEILAYSSNIGFAKLSKIIGDQDLWQYARYYGYGMKTGIELAGEESGSLNPPAKWSGVSCQMMSFGQGLSATALQIVNSFSAVANGGILMEPKIVKSVIYNDKEIQKLEPVRIRRVVSADTAASIRKMLEAVVDYGTGTQAKIDGVKIAGKTGTAQKYDKHLRRYSDSKYVSLFAGFFPSEKPEITVLVVVDEPRGDYWAASVAVPIFRDISTGIIEYMNIGAQNKLAKK